MTLEARERHRLVQLYLKKVLGQCVRDPAGFPHYSESGSWVTTPDGYWTGGFWVGQLWWLWHVTGNPDCHARAMRLQRALEHRKDAARVNFDLGFLYRYSFALGHELTGETSYRSVALAAADRLLELQHPANGLIYCEYRERTAEYGSRTVSSIVDVMMNLQLLWWAYRETGDFAYRRAAEEHARAAAEWLVRDDGSTVHLVDFDRGTGEVLRRGSRQGHDPDSCWSRGQAWGIYGFLEAHAVTESPALLEVCRRLLDYWTGHLPGDLVPPWDFAAPPDTRQVRDTSAAAILCAALARARLLGLTVLPDQAGLLHDTLASLADRYLVPETESGVLAGGCFHFPAARGVNAATVWGDYYFLEALVGS